MSSHPLPPASTAHQIDWREVEDLLDELSIVARAELPADEFYRQLLARLVPAAGAAMGRMWVGESTSLRLVAEFDRATGKAPVDGSRRASSAPPALCDVARSGRPQVVAATGAAGDQASGEGRTTTSGALHPVGPANAARGVLELSFVGELAPATGRSVLRLLAAAGELIDDFSRHHELRRLQAREQRLEPFEHFGLTVHRSLELRATALAIANDGRRAIGCDRVSVLVRKGKRFQLLATSGVDVIDSRSPMARGLENLATASARTEEPLWYSDGAADLPVEIERPLNVYLDATQVRALALVPLRAAPPDSTTPGGTLVGMLAAEQFQHSIDDAQLRERVTAIADHAALALANSVTVSRQPLAWLTRSLARVRWLVESRQLPKTVLVFLALAAMAAALALVPADFAIEARGELLPKTRREVFATDSGVISELTVDHAQQVHAGEPLLVIRKPELDLEFRRVAGEMQTADKKLAAIQAERLENAQSGSDARRRARQLTADEEELKEELKGLREQYDILERHQQELVVRSPIDGEAMTWNIKQLLDARPVERGQALLTVADLSGPWELELHLQDHRAGHVLLARDALRPALEVTFVLLADPGREYHGSVSDMAMASELDEDGRPIVRVTVDFDRREVDSLRAGATAIARIDCGRRSLGYVWLHDLFEFVQSHWWW